MADPDDLFSAQGEFRIRCVDTDALIDGEAGQVLEGDRDEGIERVWDPSLERWRKRHLELLENEAP